MFDNIRKYLAETFSEDYATWLLDKPVTLTSLSPKELSLQPIWADALILGQSDDFITFEEGLYQNTRQDWLSLLLTVNCSRC